MESIAAHYNSSLRFELVEPESGDVQKYKPFVPASKWDSGPVIQLMKDICSAVFTYKADVHLHDASRSPTSTIQIVVDDLENRGETLKVAQALTVLFNAIGKANGRILIVDVISRSNRGPARAQP